jgi:hypothetical protein
MPTPAQNRAAQIAAKRRRTPRILRVVQDGSTSISVTFDRPMDENFDRAVIRTFDEVNVGLEWTNGSWTDARTWESSTSSVVPDLNEYEGPRFAVYMSGDLRASARFPVSNGERCDRVEDA